jgi:stage V sporulation protein S
MASPEPLARGAARPAAASSDQPVAALKVSASSRPTAVAGAIAGIVRERGRAEVLAIGAGAINQAIKAVAIARNFLATSQVDLVCVPYFVEVTVESAERTAIRLVVEPRGRTATPGGTTPGGTTPGATGPQEPAAAPAR